MWRERFKDESTTPSGLVESQRIPLWLPESRHLLFLHGGRRAPSLEFRLQYSQPLSLLLWAGIGTCTESALEHLGRSGWQGGVAVQLRVPSGLPQGGGWRPVSRGNPGGRWPGR